VQPAERRQVDDVGSPVIRRFVYPVAAREGASEVLRGLDPCHPTTPARSALPNPSHTTALCKGLGSKGAVGWQESKNRRDLNERCSE
jgi:hypothetical protein